VPCYISHLGKASVGVSSTVRNPKDQQIIVATAGIGMAVVTLVVGLFVWTGRIPLTDMLLIAINALVTGLVVGLVFWWRDKRRQRRDG
jgi:membrane associated rhomboid family serine protease